MVNLRSQKNENYKLSQKEDSFNKVWYTDPIEYNESLEKSKADPVGFIWKVSIIC
jgi:hypothetical protein